MKKLRLIGVHSQKEELLRELMLLGCVEVSDPAGRPDREELAAFAPAYLIESPWDMIRILSGKAEENH